MPNSLILVLLFWAIVVGSEWIIIGLMVAIFVRLGKESSRPPAKATKVLKVDKRTVWGS